MFQPSDSLTVKNANGVLEAGLQAIGQGQIEIDLAKLTTVDSVAVATMLAWQRAAAQRGTGLTFANLPANLQSLVDVYGVADLLQPDARTETVG